MGLDIVPMPSFFSHGDDSFFAILEYEGAPAGNIFMTRHGRRIYFIVLGGFYFDEPASWAELLEPKLAYLERYDP